MWRSVTGAGLILLLSICVSCSRKNQTSATQSVPPSERYVEAVNTASGTFSIDANFNEDKQPSTVNITQAYGRVVPNLGDTNKKDVLVVLVEKPLSRASLSIMDDTDAEGAAQDFREMLHNRDARGLVIRLPGGDKTQPEIRAYFNGNDVDLGNLKFEPATRDTEEVEGHIKSTASSQQADITFSVKLHPDLWTGGAFYQQPPTKLAAGQASGQLVVNERVVNLNHAYARLIDLDLFDETKNQFKVWFTEKPIDAEKLVDDSALQQRGDGVVVTYTTTGPGDRIQLSVLSGNKFDPFPGTERDYVKHAKDAIEGRVYSSFPVDVRDRVYEIDLLFNAAMLPPAASDGPVTASDGGEALPADGGAPAKAYLAAMEQMRAAKDFDQRISTLLGVVTKDAADKMTKDVRSLSQEQRQLLAQVFAPLENARLTGGMIKDNKATLRFAGTSEGSKAEEAVNMHLEDGQWKIGRREIRVEE